MAAFARPWRAVEDIPPAVVHTWPDEYFKLDVKESDLFFRSGNVVVTLTPEELDCRLRRPEAGVPETKIPLQHVLGAKVLYTAWSHALQFVNSLILRQLQ